MCKQSASDVRGRDRERAAHTHTVYEWISKTVRLNPDYSAPTDRMWQTAPSSFVSFEVGCESGRHGGAAVSTVSASQGTIVLVRIPVQPGSFCRIVFSPDTLSELETPSVNACSSVFVSLRHVATCVCPTTRHMSAGISSSSQCNPQEG